MTIKYSLVSLTTIGVILLVLSDVILAQEQIKFPNLIAEGFSERLGNIDSLLSLKSDVLEQTIKFWQERSPSADTSAKQLLPFNMTKRNAQMGQVDHPIEQYCSQQLIAPQDIAWLQDHLGQLQQMEGVIDQYQGKILDLADLEQLSNYQQQLQELTSVSQGYFQEVNNLLSGGITEGSTLMETLQSKIGHYPEFQELQAKTAELEQFKQLSQKYGANYARQQRQKTHERLMAKAKEIGADAFKEHQPKVQEVQDKFQKLKKKYRSVADARDLSTAIKRSSLKGEPLSERLVLGGTFQVVPSFSRQINQQTVKESSASVDLSPLIGYRLNKKFTVGLGATYRAHLDQDELPRNSLSANYGGRAFLDYYPLDSFFLHGEYESMSSQLAQASSSGEVSRQWINGALMGIGKEYPFFKGVKGQVMVLYNFLYDHSTSPYEKAWVIRFGFVI